MFYPKINLLMDQGRFEEAEAAIREELSESIGDPGLLFVLLSTALNRQDRQDRQDRPKQAEEAAREAIVLGPEFDMSHFALSQALLSQNRHKEALTAIEEAIRLDPDDADYHGIRARILAEDNPFAVSSPYDAALESAEAGLAIDPENETCRFYRSLILGRMGRHDDAAAETLGLLADSPEDSYNHSARGWILLDTNDIDGARMHFSEALRLDATNEDARLGLVQVLKLRNPVLGWLARLLVQLGRIPIVPLIGAVLILLAISDGLDNSDGPLAWIGSAFRIAFYVVFLAALVADPLFHLVLRFSKDGRNALSDDERRAVRWSAVPLVIGGLFLVLWILGGGKYMPLHAITWLAAVRMISEIFETRNPWVRKWMTAAALLVLAAAVWIEIASYGINLPATFDLMKDVPTDPEGFADDELLKERLRGIIRMRQQMVDYPVLAVYFLAVFSDNLRDWLHRFAPDSEG